MCRGSPIASRRRKTSRCSSGRNWRRGFPPGDSPESACGRRRAITSSTRGAEMPLPFEGRLVLVTGASRGIGAATAARLAGFGAVVVRIARSEPPPLTRALDFRADLADPVQRAEVLRRVQEQCGLPWAVVNNAGAFLLAPLEQTSDDLLREQMAINLEAPFAVARAFLPAMRSRGNG